MAEIKRVLKDPKQKQLIENNLILLRNELATETKLNRKVKLQVKVDDLVYQKVDIRTIGILNNYFDDLNKYFIQKFNKASEAKDLILSQQQNSEAKKQKFIQLKKDYQNQELYDLVKNVNEAVKIVEYENHLYQKADPVFFDPQGGLLSAHFYAPRKKVFGTYFDTFWVNIIVIWSMSIALFICLYFNLLRKLLELGEGTSDRIKKKRQSKKLKAG